MSVGRKEDTECGMRGWKHTPESKEKLRQSKLGAKNHQWVDKNPSYGSVHVWLDRNFKKLDACEHCGGNRFIEWALKKGCKYDHKRENYLCLCSSCHKKYDYTLEHRRKTSRAMKGRKITWGDKISKAKTGSVLSKEHRKKLSVWNKKHPRPRNEKGQFYSV